MADLSLEFSSTGFWDTVIRAFFKQAPLSADVHVSQVLHRGNTIYTTDRKGRGAGSWPQRWQPKHIWRLEICKIIWFRQRQKIFFSNGIYEGARLPSSGCITKRRLLQQGCERTQAVWSCRASGWSDQTLQMWSPEIPENVMLRYNTWGSTDGGVSLKCSLWELHLFGASWAGGGPGLLLLFKQFSLPGHLIKQQQSPLGHIWISHYFGFLQTQN